MIQKPIDNRIDAQELWRGIGGHFDSLSQILHELIDNSISNFKKFPNLAHHTVLIHFDTKELQNEKIKIKIEDTGTGIEDLNSAFTIGSKRSQQTPMNEHGFGLKHALASANKENSNWCVYTRTNEEVKENKVVKIEASYQLENYHASVVDFSLENYPTLLSNNLSGTIIEFETSVSMFRTIGKHGTKDSLGLISYLKENLGFIYSGIISSGIAEIQIKLDEEDKIHVKSIEPWWDKTITPGNGSSKVDLGIEAGGTETGIVNLHYKFGTVKKRIPVEPNEKVVYYGANMQTSGVEIRLNGRVICYNLLNEIWDQSYQHNRFNNFLVIINLESDNIESLPSTRSSKNGFRKGDLRLQGLFNWIKKHCSEPYENKYNRDEIHLFQDLKTLKLKSLSGNVPEPLTVELERKLLANSQDPIRVDLFVSFGNKVIIYEGKTGSGTPIDLYQLKLYWDASILEGIQPTMAVLLAISHSSTTQDLAAFNNTLKDGNGNFYNFVLKTWIDEGIDFPKKEM